MSDDRWMDRLSEYLDGELTPEERRELEAHLAECASCRTTLEELRARRGEARATLEDIFLELTGDGDAAALAMRDHLTEAKRAFTPAAGPGPAGGPTARQREEQR